MSDKTPEDQDSTRIQPLTSVDVNAALPPQNDATLIKPFAAPTSEETHITAVTSTSAAEIDQHAATHHITSEHSASLHALIEKGVENSSKQKPLVADDDSSADLKRTKLEQTIALTEYDKTYLKTVLHTTSVEEAKHTAKKSLILSIAGLVIVLSGLGVAIFKNIQGNQKETIIVSELSEVEFKSHFVVSLENNALHTPPKNNASYYLNQWKQKYPEDTDLRQAERLLSNAYIIAAKSAREKNNLQEAEELMEQAIKIVTK